MKCFIDGDQLCITNNDFINLQESNALFIPLSYKQICVINKFKKEKDAYKIWDNEKKEKLKEAKK